jgi:glycosyltransferase involved in cell wall biosynthesis
MATGLPVVATQHGGIPEAVTSGRDGLLVPEKSPAQLASALLQLLANPAQLAALSTEAARSVRANFEAETQIAKMEDVYFEAIAQWQARAAAAAAK